MVKFGQRIIRGVFYGAVMGFILYLVTYFLTTAITLTGVSIPTNALSLGAFGIGFTAPLAIEISKDMEEQK